MHIANPIYDSVLKYINTPHILEIDENDFPTAYRPIIRKLQEACASQEVIQQMEAEDHYVSDIQIYNKENTLLKEELIQQKKALAKEKAESRKKDEELAKLKKELEQYKKGQ